MIVQAEVQADQDLEPTDDKDLQGQRVVGQEMAGMWV